MPLFSSQSRTMTSPSENRQEADAIIEFRHAGAMLPHQGNASAVFDRYKAQFGAKADLARYAYVAPLINAAKLQALINNQPAVAVSALRCLTVLATALAKSAPVGMAATHQEAGERILKMAADQSDEGVTSAALEAFRKICLSEQRGAVTPAIVQELKRIASSNVMSATIRIEALDSLSAAVHRVPEAAVRQPPKAVSFMSRQEPAALVGFSLEQLKALDLYDWSQPTKPNIIADTAERVVSPQQREAFDTISASLGVMATLTRELTFIAINGQGREAVEAIRAVDAMLTRFPQNRSDVKPYFVDLVFSSDPAIRDEAKQLCATWFPKTKLDTTLRLIPTGPGALPAPRSEKPLSFEA